MAGDTAWPGESRGDDQSETASPELLILYADADLRWAEWVAWELQNVGRPRLEAWLAPGENRTQALLSALRTSRHTVVLLSEAAVSPGALTGWDAAYRADAAGFERRLVPVVLERCEIPEPFAGLVAIPSAGLRPAEPGLGPLGLAELDESEAREALLGGLEQAVHGRRRPTSAPPFPGGAGARSRDLPGDDPSRPRLGRRIPVGPGQLFPRFPGVRLPGELTDLLARVTDAYQEEFPGARVSRRVGRDGQLRYLEIETEADGAEPGRGPRRWPVGVVPGDLDEAALERFVAEVLPRSLQPVDRDDSELVHAGAAPEDRLARRARTEYAVRPRSLREVERGWDPKRYRARQVDRLARAAEYPPALYVPQRFVRFDEPPATPPHPDVFAEIVRWFGDDGPRLVLVLADFGHGKTFLARELARRLPAELPRLTPLLINLRSYEKHHPLDQVLNHHLRENGEDRVPIRSVLRMLAEGQLVLIFDGFDELATRLTFDEAALHLDMILSALRGRAKVLVTSRTQHFASTGQLPDELRAQVDRPNALGAKVDLLTDARIVRLAGFDGVEIRDFLTRFYTLNPARAANGVEIPAGEAARRRHELLADVTDLSGLSQTPRMLGFIAELPEPNLLAARAVDGTVTKSALYHELLDWWLKGEEERRRQTRYSREGLDASQLRTAVTALAVRLWRADGPALTLAELKETVAETLPELGETQLDAAQAAFTVGSGSLLVRDERDRWEFVHLSVLEYLVAEAAAAQFGATGDSSLAGDRVMSPLVVEFLIGAGDQAILRRWVSGLLQAEEPAPMPDSSRRRLDRFALRVPGWRRMAEERALWREAAAMFPRSESVARENATALAARLGMRLLDLSGQDLRGADLASLSLRAADLRRTDLSGVQVYGLDLRDADLRDANLSGAGLRDVDLRGADLRGANLTRARLERPRLAGARLEGSRWRQAALLAPELDAATVAAVELGEAGWPGRDQVTPEVSLVAVTIRALAWSPDGTLLALARGTQVVLVDANLGLARVLDGHGGDVWAVGFSPDGRLVVSGEDKGETRLWDVESGDQVWRAATSRVTGVSAVGFSPDGRLVALGGRDGAVHLWHAVSGGLVRTLPGHAVSGGLVRTLPGHAGGVDVVEFSPDGRLVASGDEGGVVRLWEVRSGGRARTLTGHAGAVRAVAFRPDGRLVVSGGKDGRALLSDVESGGKAPNEVSCRLRQRMTGPVGEVRAVGFSLDVPLVASADDAGVVRLWEVELVPRVRTLAGHAGRVRAVGFRPDGRMVASGDEAGVVWLWQVVTGVLIARLVPLAEGGWAVLLPDGSYKLSGDAGADLWWMVNQTRFTPDELTAHGYLHRRAPDEPLLDDAGQPRRPGTAGRGEPEEKIGSPAPDACDQR